MSEKRFVETERNCYYTSLVFDKYTQEELGTDKVVVLLNKLNDERMMYKTTIPKRIVELEDENEQLRQTIQEVCELLAEANYLFSNDTYYLIPAIEKAIKLLKGGIDE